MHTPFKKSLLYAAIIAGLFLAGVSATPVWAQDDDDDEAQVEATEAEEEEAQDLDRIQVTGSRIERAGIDTFYPAITVDSQLLEDAGFTNIADALNQIPSFGPGVTPDEGQGAFTTGQNFVNFLGLGTSRTLTLVDGRRFVSSNQPVIFGASGGLQVDFNVIPVAIVERVETIGVGGAPIYGSDAIAGTINVITKDNYEGFETSYLYGVSEEGDNDRRTALMLGGTNFDGMRGNVYASAEYTWQDAVPGTARPEIRDQSQFAVESDGIARIQRDRRINIFTNGGLAGPGFCPASLAFFGPDCPIPSFGIGRFPDGNFYQFDTNSNLVPFTPGVPRPGSFFFAKGGDGPTFFDDVEQINSDVERGVFTSGLTYEISPSIEWSSDFLYSTTDSTELVNQGGFQTFAFGLPGEESGPIRFTADHPFLPQQARDVLAQNGIDEFFVHRFNNDIIDSSVNLKQNLWRLTGGFNGDFEFADRVFNWDVHFVHGETDIVTQREGIINERFFNAVRVRRLTEEDLAQVNEAQLLSFSGTSSAGVGDLICEAAFEAAINGVSDERAPFVTGCVPLNVFGEGVRSNAARDWVTGDLTTQSDLEQTVGNASISGELFDLPGGAFAAAFGFEHREENGDFRPDLASKIGLTRSAPFPPTGGGYRTDEWFGEFSAPILSSHNNIPFVDLLEINGAYRSIDNSLAGSDDVWTLGGRFAPISGLTFRGNYTEAVRAPSIVELFTPQTQSFSFANDPCDNRFVDGGPVPEIRRANCTQALGINPDDFTSNVVNATATGRTGGNPDLGNEQAESWAAGFTWEPAFIDNLLFTADWIDVEINEAITSLTLTALMEACFDSPNFPNVSACDRFTRNDAGQIIDFLTGQTNAQTLETTRAQIGINYSYEWDGIGRFNFNNRTSYANNRKISVTGEEASQTIGGFTFPKWSGTQDIVFTRDRHRAFWRILWQKPAKLSISGDTEFERDDGERVSRTRLRHLHNISYSYRLPKLAEFAPEETFVQFNVDNLFDRQPDTVERAAGHFGFSELIGRSYTLSLRGVF